MSGMSSGGGGGDSGRNNCATLAFRTQIATPNEELVKLISIGDVLQVGLVTQGDRRLVAVLRDGQIVGGLASREVNALRSCLDQGYFFVAQVLSTDDGEVLVRVVPAP